MKLTVPSHWLVRVVVQVLQTLLLAQVYLVLLEASGRGSVRELSQLQSCLKRQPLPSASRHNTVAFPENEKVEELLFAERELSKSYEARIKQLQQDLSVSKNDVMRIEFNMAEALAIKNSEIEALVSATDGLKKEAAISEGNMASLQFGNSIISFDQANMESMMRRRELTKTRMMQALREEQASAERRAEEEHAAHNASKMVCFHGKGSGIRTKSYRGLTTLARIRVMELRSENIHSVKIVMCIYRKLLIYCKEKMYLIKHHSCSLDQAP
ncbi:hypothetical protein FNV43_RR25010 [Rhamnella rubrinervis]|uniref:Uncharacterized protein n=1 Tax=Rhamnella rubrinervis TaxID=2594499 RepID=A0A8K0DML3_9ROSA|nr:hypothetical protein FNV43_RR25010 [Rhamnella rubrinervis]